jgi:hypothetical protein
LTHNASNLSLPGAANIITEVGDEAEFIEYSTGKYRCTNYHRINGMPLSGDLDTNGHQIQWSKGADVVSATSLPVLTDGNYFDVTGTTAVTSLKATGGKGTLIKLHFDGILTLTHSAAPSDIRLILPSGANITTAAGDEAEFIQIADTGSPAVSVYRCINYTRASGIAISTEIKNDSTPQLGGDLDTNGHQIQWSKGADVKCANALPVLTDGNYFDIAVSTTTPPITVITSINTTGGEGTLIKLHFDAAYTLTHSAVDLILPGGANIVTAAGDESEFIEYAAGKYRCTSYTKASGKAVTASGIANIVEDVTPQLGGMLDVNGKDIGDGTLELLKFSETASAINEFTIANAATGNGPTLSATGTGYCSIPAHTTSTACTTASPAGIWTPANTNVDINISPKGSGSVVIGGDLDANGNQMQGSKGADVKCANALGSVSTASSDLTDGNYFDVIASTEATPITVITSINTTGGEGTVIKLHFDAAYTLTHSAADLILPGGANIVTAAGDESEFIEYAAGKYRCTSYTRASGIAISTEIKNDTTPQLGGDLDCNGSQIQWSKGADVASAAALNVLTDGNYFDVTSATTVTSIKTTGGKGTLIKLHFDSTPLLTHNTTTLILPGGANIKAAAGDEAEFIEYTDPTVGPPAQTYYRCTNYTRASGEAIVVPASGDPAGTAVAMAIALGG